MAKRKTNEDLVSHMMNFSKTGLISQMAIIEAISRYAKECIAITDEDIEENSRSIISYRALRDWGNETKERMTHFYETNNLN